MCQKVVKLYHLKRFRKSNFKDFFKHGDDYQKAIKWIQCLILECFRTSNFNVFNHDEVQKVVKSSQSRAFHHVKFQNFLQQWWSNYQKVVKSSQSVFRKSSFEIFFNKSEIMCQKVVKLYHLERFRIQISKISSTMAMITKKQ